MHESPYMAPGRASLLRFLAESPHFDADHVKSQKSGFLPVSDWHVYWIRHAHVAPNPWFDPVYYHETYGVRDRHTLWDFLTHGWRVGNKPAADIDITQLYRRDVHQGRDPLEMMAAGDLGQNAPPRALPQSGSGAPLVSVVTVNMNNKAGLTETLDSIRAQTFRDFEFIVIDGGSTDGSVELLEQNRDMIDHLSVGEDKGIFDGMNLAARRATGDYVLYMNSGDCLAGPDTLERVGPYLDGPGVVHGKIRFAGEEKIHPYRKNIAYGMAFCHQAQYTRRDLLLEHPFSTEHRFSDWRFNADIYRSGATFLPVPDVVAIVEPHGYSSRFPLAGFLERYSYAARHFTLPEIHEFYQKHLERLEKETGA